MAKDQKKPKPTAEESAAKLAALTSGVASISHFGIKGPAPAPMLPGLKAAAPAAPTAAEPAAALAPAPAATEAAAESATTEPAATEPVTTEPSVTEPTAAEPGAGESGPTVAESTETASEPAAAAQPEQEQKGENDGVGEGLPALTPPAQPVAGPPAQPEPTSEPASEVAAPGPDATKAVPAESSSSEDEPATDEDGPAVAAAAGEYDIASVFVPAKDKKTILIRITPDNQEFFMNLGTMLGSGASAPDIIHNILIQWRETHEIKAKKAMQKRLREMLTKK